MAADVIGMRTILGTRWKGVDRVCEALRPKKQMRSGCGCFGEEMDGEGVDEGDEGKGDDDKRKESGGDDGNHGRASGGNNYGDGGGDDGNREKGGGGGGEDGGGNGDSGDNGNSGDDGNRGERRGGEDKEKNGDENDELQEADDEYSDESDEKDADQGDGDGKDEEESDKDDDGDKDNEEEKIESEEIEEGNVINDDEETEGAYDGGQIDAQVRKKGGEGSKRALRSNSEDSYLESIPSVLSTDEEGAANVSRDAKNSEKKSDGKRQAPSHSYKEEMTKEKYDGDDNVDNHENDEERGGEEAETSQVDGKERSRLKNEEMESGEDGNGKDSGESEKMSDEDESAAEDGEIHEGDIFSEDSKRLETSEEDEEGRDAERKKKGKKDVTPQVEFEEEGGEEKEDTAGADADGSDEDESEAGETHEAGRKGKREANESMSDLEENVEMQDEKENLDEDSDAEGASATLGLQRFSGKNEDESDGEEEDARHPKAEKKDGVDALDMNKRSNRPDTEHKHEESDALLSELEDEEGESGNDSPIKEESIDEESEIEEDPDKWDLEEIQGLADEVGAKKSIDVDIIFDPTDEWPDSLVRKTEGDVTRYIEKLKSGLQSAVNWKSKFGVAELMGCLASEASFLSWKKEERETIHSELEKVVKERKGIEEALKAQSKENEELSASLKTETARRKRAEAIRKEKEEKITEIDDESAREDFLIQGLLKEIQQGRATDLEMRRLIDLRRLEHAASHPIELSIATMESLVEKDSDSYSESRLPGTEPCGESLTSDEGRNERENGAAPQDVADLLIVGHLTPEQLVERKLKMELATNLSEAKEWRQLADANEVKHRLVDRAHTRLEADLDHRSAMSTLGKMKSLLRATPSVVKSSKKKGEKNTRRVSTARGGTGATKKKAAATRNGKG